MRGLTEGAQYPWLAARLDVLLLFRGECSGGPRLGNLQQPLVRGTADIPRAGCALGGSRPGGRGREEKDACVSASPPACGAGRAFSFGNRSLNSPPRRHGPCRVLVPSGWEARVSSRAPRGHRARGGAGSEPQAAGVRGRGLSTVRSGFESPL